MVGIVEISAGLNSLKLAKDIVQALNGAQNAVAINQVKLDLQSAILDAQQGLFSAQEAQSAAAKRIADLEQEIVRLKDWSAERERYQLVDVGTGAFAFMPKVGMENGQPAHWLCANCFEHGRKSVIQFKGQGKEAGGRQDECLWGCDTCKGSFRTSWGARPNYEKRA